jgi:hypothetical protein
MEVQVICKNSSYVFNYIVPGTNHKYKFYRGRPYIVKDAEDLQHFRDNKQMFKVLENCPKIDKPKIEILEEDESNPKALEEDERDCDEEDEEEEDEEDEEEEENYTRLELESLKKSEHTRILRKNFKYNKSIPLSRSGRINLILELQEQCQDQ